MKKKYIYNLFPKKDPPGYPPIYFWWDSRSAVLNSRSTKKIRTFEKFETFSAYLYI